MRRQKKFLREVLPILQTLDSQWFPPDKTNDAGQNYACLYCDMNCSRHDKHDDDCLYQMAKDTLKKLEEIDQAIPLLRDFRGNLYSKEDVDGIITKRKVEAILAMVYKDPPRFIPLDLDDPSNRGIVCFCGLFSEETTRHGDDCMIEKLAKVYSNLFKVKT